MTNCVMIHVFDKSSPDVQFIFSHLEFSSGDFQTFTDGHETRINSKYHSVRLQNLLLKEQFTQTLTSALLSSS